MLYGWTTIGLNNYQTIIVSLLMAKLFGCKMELKMSVWTQKNSKRAYGQANFRKHHSTIDHLVTLRALTEESHLRGNNSNCCFVQFKKSFNKLLREHLWR